MKFIQLLLAGDALAAINYGRTHFHHFGEKNYPGRFNVSRARTVHWHDCRNQEINDSILVHKRNINLSLCWFVLAVKLDRDQTRVSKGFLFTFKDEFRKSTLYQVSVAYGTQGVCFIDGNFIVFMSAQQHYQWSWSYSLLWQVREQNGAHRMSYQLRSLLMKSWDTIQCLPVQCPKSKQPMKTLPWWCPVAMLSVKRVWHDYLETAELLQDSNVPIAPQSHP